MKHFCCRLISQSILRHSKSISQNQNHALRCIQMNYADTHAAKPPILSFKTANFTTSAQELSPTPAPPERVSILVDELSELTLMDIMELNEVLKQKFEIQSMPTMAVMMPGMKFGAAGLVQGGGGPAAAKAEEKAEKTAFDLKLEGGFDAGVKLKIIKEVRACTALGLKEAKELVEKAPTLLKKGVTKEEAEKIVEKMKEAGAKVTME